MSKSNSRSGSGDSGGQGRVGAIRTIGTESHRSTYTSGGASAHDPGAHPLGRFIAQAEDRGAIESRKPKKR